MTFFFPSQFSLTLNVLGWNIKQFAICIVPKQQRAEALAQNWSVRKRRLLKLLFRQAGPLPKHPGVGNVCRALWICLLYTSPSPRDGV